MMEMKSPWELLSAFSLLIPRLSLLFSFLLHLTLSSPPSHDVPPLPQLPSHPHLLLHLFLRQRQRQSFSPVLERMGIVGENGAMSDDFKVGDFDPQLAEEVLPDATTTEDKVDEEKEEIKVRVDKYELCDQKMINYIPCLDIIDGIRQLNST
uniref:Uncharacterized protein n=1 Tax=Opuntia streptacantha TaxID=393608 RepID=A0A7C9EJY9_OPUST